MAMEKNMEKTTMNEDVSPIKPRVFFIATLVFRGGGGIFLCEHQPRKKTHDWDVGGRYSLCQSFLVGSFFHGFFHKKNCRTNTVNTNATHHSEVGSSFNY